MTIYENIVFVQIVLKTNTDENEWNGIDGSMDCNGKKEMCRRMTACFV